MYGLFHPNHVKVDGFWEATYFTSTLDLIGMWLREDQGANILRTHV